jgi:hypothetical protein
MKITYFRKGKKEGRREGDAKRRQGGQERRQRGLGTPMAYSRVIWKF